MSAGEFEGAGEFTPFAVTEDDVDVVPAAASPADDGPALPADDGVPPGAASPPPGVGAGDEDPPEPSSVPDNGVEPSDAMANDGDPDTSSFVAGSQPSVNQHRPMTDINSLTNVHSLSSLVTVSGDGDTTNRGKSYGILFDVKTPSGGPSIVISGMDLYLDTTSQTHYEIWTKGGSWQDVADSNPDYSAGFRRVSGGQIAGRGASDFTRIALRDFEDVKVQGGGYRQAFYLTLSDDRLVFRSNVGEGMSRHEMSEADVVQASAADGRVDVYYGAAVRAYPLERAVPETDFWYNAGFLGRVWYREK